MRNQTRWCVPEFSLIAESAIGASIIFRMSDNPNDVNANRRRRGSGPTGRAEMPGRTGQSGGGSGGLGGGGGLGTSGGGLGGLGGGGMRGGAKGLPIGLIVLLLVVYLAIQLFGGGGSETAPLDTGFTEAAATEQPGSISVIPTEVAPIAAVVTNTPRKPVPTTSGSGTSKQTWTVMLYQDADDKILEQDIMMDLNEAERVGSSSQVNVVAQVDRYAGAYAGDGDWTSTRRYYLTQDDDLNRINSKMVQDLGELSMSDPAVLVDFVTWAVKKYPADKYVLILSDHGMGWPGGWTDPKPGGLRNRETPLSQVLNEPMMYTNDLSKALNEILSSTGIDKFELIGMDACLMSHAEVYSMLEPYARYVVASQETEPSLGWAYASFLKDLENKPGMSGAELGDKIVASYIQDDERIQDPQARVDFLSQGSPMQSFFGAPRDIDPATLTRQLSKTITLTAADMSAMPEFTQRLNDLAYALQNDDQAVVAKARTYAQSFTSIFGDQVPPSYIDLGSFANLLQQESRSVEVITAASELQKAIGKLVVAEKHGRDKTGASGVSIYFPNSQLYKNAAAGPQSYTVIANTFAEESLWDEFLAFHYTGQKFSMQTGKAVIPSRLADAVSPAEGQISVSDLQLSSNDVNYTDKVTMKATLSGANIGYVYLFVGYYDSASQSILVADKDYLESPKTKVVGELYYPNWSDQTSFNLKYDWDPIVFAINDGQHAVVTLFHPAQYGAKPEDAEYYVDATYVPADGTAERKAQLFFSNANGKLARVYGFTGDTVGAPREITPQAGDQFVLTNTWLEADGNGGYKTVIERGETLTYGPQSFTWEEQYAAAGQYVVGFLVSDLDGKEYPSLATLRVR